MSNKNSDLMQRSWTRHLYAQCIQGTDGTRKIWHTIQIAIALAEIRGVLSEIGSLIMLMDNHYIFLYYWDISWHCNQQGPLSSYLTTYPGNFIVIHLKLFSSFPNVKIEDCSKNAVTNFRSLTNTFMFMPQKDQAILIECHIFLVLQALPCTCIKHKRIG